MPPTRPTLLAYNTVDRLAHGDLFHTVTIADVLDDLAAFPDDWPLVGIGTTNWMRRNGEMVLDGNARHSRFYWTDPESEPVGRLVDLCWDRPADTGPALMTPRLDEDAREPHFPFLAVAVGSPATARMLDARDVADAHAWLIDVLAALGVGVAGIQLRGRCGAVETTDAYNVPLSGIDLSGGYTGDQYFRFARYAGDEWVVNGVYAASPSLQPFVSVAGRPLHLHGYRVAERDGGHIVRAHLVRADVTVWPLDDLVLRIHDVARALAPARGF